MLVAQGYARGEMNSCSISENADTGKTNAAPSGDAQTRVPENTEKNQQNMCGPKRLHTTK